MISQVIVPPTPKDDREGNRAYRRKEARIKGRKKHMGKNDHSFANDFFLAQKRRLGF